MKQQIIIFTGHDMAGKTTIAKEISKILNIPYFKSKKQHDKNHNHVLGLQYSIEEFTQLFEQVPQYNIIFDRFVETEFVYSKVHKRDTDFNKIWEIDTRLSKLNAKFIYCFKDEEKYQDDDMDMIAKDKYNDLKTGFDVFFKQSKCKHLYLNTSDENLKAQIETILDFILNNP